MNKTTLSKKSRANRGAVEKSEKKKTTVVTDAAGLSITLEPMGFCLTWSLILGVNLDQ